MTGKPRRAVNRRVVPEHFAWTPDWVMRPGVCLQDVMAENNLSVGVMAGMCKTDEATIEGVLDGSVPITERIAHLMAIIGPSAQFWLNMERNYREGLAAGKKDISDD